MAERQYNPTQLVALPRLKAREALALARALLAVARRHDDLPPSVATALDDLEAAAAALAEALGTRDRKATLSLRDADRVEDNAVGALVDACKAWLRLPPDHAPRHTAAARACLDVMLEDGTLGFLTFKPMVEHSEVQRRLDALVARGVDAELRAVGLGLFLDHLLLAHGDYGDACAASTAPKEEPAEVAPATAEASESMRAYVVQVVASVDRRRPATQERADALLEPLRTWTSAPAKADVAPDAPPANDADAARRKVG